MKYCDKYKYSETMVYAIAWLLIFSIPWFSHFYSSVDIRLVIITWSHLLPFLLIFLVNDVILLPFLFLRNRKTLYAVAVIFILLTVWFGIQPPVPMHRHNDMAHPGPPFDMFRITNVIITSCIIFANIAIKLYIISLKKDMMMLKIRNEQISTELKSLIYQINPHFLMNTLNNIQALIEIDPEKAYATIQEFSRMMRYVLYEQNDREVSLRQEVDFMNNFIRLMKIRYPDQVDISVNFPDIDNVVKVPPLLFITFIENAFKHGISYREESMMSINLEISDNRIVFRCLNSKPTRISPVRRSSNGIGLENVRRRLQLLYGNDFSLEICDRRNSYMVQLNIPISI